ncbi:MAG: hypothetical protein QM692_00515 [Thermomicrobiales bacterium]
MPAWMYQHVAAEAGLGSLDIDATSAGGIWLARQGGHDGAYIPAATIWTSAEQLSNPRVVALQKSLADQQFGALPATVIVAGSLQHRDLSRMAQPVLLNPKASPMIGLTAAHLRGGRPHLVQLGALRRFAEEWDLGLALDLTGRLDPTWEAEAAVTRLGPRLRLIRVRDSAPSRAAVGLDRVACRALHAALDREHPLVVAIASSRMTPFPTTPRAAAIGAIRASDYVYERCRGHLSALREGIGRYEQSRTSRGA